MNDEMPHDDQLRALYRKLPADEPRAQLDDAILAAARKRARKTARLRVLQRVRWTVSLAAAAGLVLTLTLNRLTSEPDLKRANDSAVQLTEFAQPADAPAPAPAALDALEDRDARREDTPAAAAPSEKAASQEINDRKQEARPLAKDVEAGRARLEADGTSPLAKPKSDKPAAPEAKATAPLPTAGLGGAAAPDSNEGGAGKPAAKSPSADVRSSLQSLGYMRGGYEAAASAPPRPDAADRATGAAPATNDGVAASEAAPAQPLAPMEPWPFGLESGLTPEEACRRVSEALSRDCRFFAGFVDMPLAPAATIDRGRLAGRSASRLTMSLRRDKLWTVIFEFTAPDGSFTQESLIAPDPVWLPTPTPVPESKE